MNAVERAAKNVNRRIPRDNGSTFENDHDYFRRELSQLLTTLARIDSSFAFVPAVERGDMESAIRLALPTSARPLFDRLLAMRQRELSANREALYAVIRERIAAEQRDDSR
jgi:hypothetical protein